MPHTSRRQRKKPTFQKINHVEDDDGWTHVARGSTVTSPMSRVTRQNGRGPAPEMMTFPQEEALRKLGRTNKQQPHRPSGAIYDKLQLEKAFDKVKTTWNTEVQSHEWAGVRDLLTHLVTSDRLGTIDTAICLGLGSPSCPASNHGATSNAPLWQLVAFLYIFETVVSKHEKQELRLFAQDPCFNETDEAFLETRGVTVIRHPDAASLIGSTSFVFAPHFPLMWWPTALRNEPVPLVVGNNVMDGLSEEKIMKPSSLRELFKGVPDEEIPDFFVEAEFLRFTQSHDHIKLPRLETNSQAFAFMCLFWRNSGGDEPDVGSSASSALKANEQDTT